MNLLKPRLSCINIELTHNRLLDHLLSHHRVLQHLINNRSNLRSQKPILPKGNPLMAPLWVLSDPFGTYSVKDRVKDLLLVE